MKTRKTKKGTFTITGISPMQEDVISRILNATNNRCFDEQDNDGNYYSNDDFVVVLTAEERYSLKKICKII